MIITLKGANFSSSNIGTLSTWSISRVLGSGATYNGSTYVDKNAALSATITIADGYELGSAGVTVTMGGTVQSGVYSQSGNVITISIGSVTGNVVIKVPTVNTSTGEEDSGNGDTGDSTATLTLYQGYANGSTTGELETRVRTDFIEGAFSVTTNSGYVIRAIWEYSTPSVKSGTEIVSASQALTTYTKTSTSGYCIITFCKSDATAAISPTEDIVGSFTGTIYSNDGTSGDDTATEPSTTIEVSGIRIGMGQILSSKLNLDHTGRAYTVDPLNDKTTISTAGSSFVMIPIIDTDDDLTNGSSTLYTSTDGTFNNESTGSLQYHDTIAIADIKAINSTANIYVMFKHSTASTFALSDLSSVVTIS